MPLHAIATAAVSALLPSLPATLGNLIDRLFPDPQAAAKAKQDLLKMEQAGELDLFKTQLSAIVAEAQSPDPWTSRARPTFLYVVYVYLLLVPIGAIVGIWHPAEVTLAAENMETMFNALPGEIVALFGTVLLGYIGARSYEKSKGVAR